MLRQAIDNMPRPSFAIFLAFGGLPTLIQFSYAPMFRNPVPHGMEKNIEAFQRNKFNYATGDVLVSDKVTTSASGFLSVVFSVLFNSATYPCTINHFVTA